MGRVKSRYEEVWDKADDYDEPQSQADMSDATIDALIDERQLAGINSPESVEKIKAMVNALIDSGDFK